MKSRQIYTFFLPDLIPEGLLNDSVAVVIDILRATTTMTTGIANGAARIVPCVGVDQAHLTKQRLSEANLALAENTSPSSVLLGGERLGKPLPGFDLGNAPETYSPESVRGRTIVMTTTNGTRAMDRCRGAKQIVIGSFANLSTVVQHLSQSQRVALVCSGTDKHVTCEDVLFAGAVTDELIRSAHGSDLPWEINDQAELARSYWRQSSGPDRFPTMDSILAVFRRSLGGSNLIAQGRAVDLEFAAAIDRFNVLPILDQRSWEITAAPM
ncbi:MAG: 2-phosphosulfolactate phosphatase [Planctomycetaceae bacterium]|nr:2-phosphosulfolactate phosphatase [Planctomycetaceae bacterium]